MSCLCCVDVIRVLCVMKLVDVSCNAQQKSGEAVAVSASVLRVTQASTELQEAPT